MSKDTQEETSAGGVVFRHAGAETLWLIIRDSYENWGFPKGHLHDGEAPEKAALREVSEETGLAALELRSHIALIDWHFRFRGKLIHKFCHFFLIETLELHTRPQKAEGITACRWVSYDDASRLVSYANAKDVLKRARALLGDRRRDTPSPEPAR